MGLIFGGVYMDEYLRFENAIFCSSNCNFLKFSAHNLIFITDFSTFLFLIMHLQLSILTTFSIMILQKAIEWVSNPVFSARYFAFPFPRKFNVLFKFNYSKFYPRGLIFGGAYTWKEFSVSKVGS